MIQKIKSRLSCVEYLSRQGIHVKNGGRCVSPLRPGARNPTSFTVTDDFWYDFGSAQGGDVIDLAAQLRYDGDVSRAVRELADELGIQRDNQYSETFKTDIQNLCNRTAAYHAALTDSDRDYLYKRGLTDDDISRLMIGRVTDGYLRGRLFLPYFKNGATVYYATRALPGSSFQDNKYMKASRDESPSYQHIPWGLHTLSQRNHGHDTLVISEGYFDAAAWEINGYPVISPITGNFSRDQWPDVISACKLFNRVLIIFDNDAVSHAGDGFTARTARKLFQNRIPFVVAHTPPGVKDVNDYYTSGGNLADLVSSAQDGLTYIVQQYDDPVELKNFILSINRYTDPTQIIQALETTRFPASVIKSIQKTADTAPSESVIVDEIIAKHNIIYIVNVGFYEWDSRVWNRIEDDQVRNYADILYGKRFSTAQRVSAVCNLLKARAVTDTVFDRLPVLTFQNGTLEIETGKFRDFSPDDYCSIIMDYDYDPVATAPLWERFIEDVTDEEPRRQEILQFIAGYVLVPDCRFQKVFILTGGGGNGKSVYLEIMQKLFGSKHTSHVEPSGLTKDFQRIRLKDSLWNIGTDINSNFSNGEIREWMIKISDGTAIQACYKMKNYVDFIPRCKLVYACNELPTAEIVKGLDRRFQFISFPCQYVEVPDPNNPRQKPRDINIIPKLTAELPGIFNWCYAGYKLLMTVGYFTDAPEQEDFLQQFKRVSDPVVVFCEDHNFYGSIDRDEIYDWYKGWCDRTGHKSLSREKFMPKFRDCLGDRITNERRTTKEGRRVRVFDFAI